MTVKRTSAVLAAVLICAAGLSACDFAAGREIPPPPGPPVPPTPELPMTGAKAREIIGDLPVTCTGMATLKMDMLTCAERQGKPADHAAFRSELRDLRWNLQKLPPEEATAQCTAMLDEMRSKPKPEACWDLGIG